MVTWGASLLFMAIFAPLPNAEGPHPPKQATFEVWSTIDAGGTSQGGAFKLNATIAQADAIVMTGPGVRLTGGFWAVTRNDPDPPTAIFIDGFETGDVSGWSEFNSR